MHKKLFGLIVITVGWLPMQAFCVNVNIKDFNTAGDHKTDDSSAFQRAIDYVYEKGGGKIALNGNQRYHIGKTLKLKPRVVISGDLNRVWTSGPYLWDNIGSALELADGKCIEMSDDTYIEGVLFYRNGQIIPDEEAETNFRSFAVLINGNNCSVKLCGFIGFAQGIITSANKQRDIDLEDLVMDSTTGVHIQNCFEGLRIRRIHIYPAIGLEYRKFYRTDYAFIFEDVHNGLVEDCFIIGRKNGGFSISNCNNCRFIACGADNLRIRGGGNELKPIGYGFRITGNSNNNSFLACQSALQSAGYLVDIDDGCKLAIKGGALWAMGDYGINVRGGDVDIFNNVIRGYTKNKKITTCGVHLENPKSKVNIRTCSFHFLEMGIKRTAGIVNQKLNVAKNVDIFYKDER
ncbi:MAG: hypothetical protein ACYSSI_04630 [Planctomycetota bacterium]